MERSMLVDEILDWTPDNLVLSRGSLPFILEDLKSVWDSLCQGDLPDVANRDLDGPSFYIM